MILGDDMFCFRVLFEASFYNGFCTDIDLDFGLDIDTEYTGGFCDCYTQFKDTCEMSTAPSIQCATSKLQAGGENLRNCFVDNTAFYLVLVHTSFP